MIPYIENYENPQVGDFFMVRTVRFKRNNKIFLFPVFSESHVDNGPNEQPQEHYHIDWRFMSEKIVREHRLYYRNLYGSWRSVFEAEYFEPIMKDEVVDEFYMKWEYYRDFFYPEDKAASFDHVKEEMKKCGAVMKKMRCPHHGTNLTSCKPVDGVVTCPQHGLKWNVKTGELVL